MKRILKINNPEYLLLLFFGLAYYIFVLYDNHLSLNFNYQYFLYDYNFGFVKRGLVGSILNFLPFKISEQIFVAIVTLLIIFLGLLVVKIIDYIDFSNKFYGYFLICFLVVNPALLKNLWYDIGRLDIFGILYCLFLIFPLKRNITTILFIFSPLILFIHEGFFLLWLPTYFICWWIKNNCKITKNIIFYSSFFILSSIIYLFFISKYGKIHIDFYVFENYLKTKTDNLVFIENTVITDSLYSQIYSSFILNFTHIKFWFLGFISLFSMVYVIKIICRLLRINFSKYKIIYIPLFFSSLMFFLGSDALRWFSNMCFSLFIMLMAILVSNKEIIKSKKDMEDITINLNDFAFLIFLLLIMLPFKHLGVLWW